MNSDPLPLRLLTWFWIAVVGACLAFVFASNSIEALGFIWSGIDL